MKGNFYEGKLILRIYILRIYILRIYILEQIYKTLMAAAQ